MRLPLTLQQPAQHPQVAGECLAVGIEQQGGDLRGMPLPEPVDAPVALFDPDQAPRNVEVDQLVTVGMQVDALGGDVASHQDPDRAGLQLEAVDDLLLLGVAETAVQLADLAIGQLQVLPQSVGQPVQGAQPLGEHHRPFAAAWADLDLLQVLQQTPVLARGIGALLSAEIPQVLQASISRCWLSVAAG